MDHNLFNWLLNEGHSGCFESFTYKHGFHEYPCAYVQEYLWNKYLEVALLSQNKAILIEVAFASRRRGSDLYSHQFCMRVMITTLLFIIMFRQIYWYLPMWHFKNGSMTCIIICLWLIFHLQSACSCALSFRLLVFFIYL